MKKAFFSFIFFVFIVLFLGISNTTFAESVNINFILNPSAETVKNNIPTDWFRLKVGVNNSFFNSKNVGQESSKSLGLSISKYKTGLSGWAFKPVEVKPNIKYSYSEYYKSNIESNVFLFYIDINGKVIRENLGKVNASSNWKKLEYDFTVPKDVKKLTILHFIKSRGELITDNYSLSEFNGSIKKDDKNIEISQSGSLDCSYLSVLQKAGNSYDTSFTCEGNTLSKNYKIEILDSVGKVINTINNKKGDYIFKTEGSYSARCLVDGKTTTTPLCQKGIIIKAPTISVGAGGGGGGGGSSNTTVPTCKNLTHLSGTGNMSPSYVFACEGNNTNLNTNYKIDIFNSSGAIVKTFNSKGGNYIFNNEGDYTAKCYVEQNTNNTSCQNTFTVTSPKVDSTVPIEEPTPPPSPDPVLNLIPNASVETVSDTNPLLPQSWNTSKSGDNDAQFTYLDTGYTGNKSLQIKITSSSGGYAFYYFDKQSVVAGADYDYSVYYKSDVAFETDIEVTTASGTVYNYVGTIPSSANWTNYTTSIKMPSDAVSVSLYTILSNPGTLITDDYSLSKQPPSELNKAIVTLSFDDQFSQSFYDNAYQSFKNHSMTGTMYLTTDYFNKNNHPTQMSQANLIEMRDYGFEIGSHTISHPHLTLMEQVDLDKELLDSKTQIEQFLGTGSIVDTFASPYGEYNNFTISHIKNYYQSHRSTIEGYNTKHNFDKYLIKAMNPVLSTTPETILSWVDEAIAKKAWLVIVLHDITNGTPESTLAELEYTYTPAQLEAVLVGLESRRTEGKIDVKTIKDALADVLSQIK